MSALAPISPESVSEEPTSLVLREKKFSLSGDSMEIKDGEDNVVFKIDAKLMTMSQRRTLTDSEGNEIGQLRKKKMPGFHPSLYIGTMDDEKKCMIQKTGTFNITNSNAKVFLGENEIGLVEGNWRAKKYTITIEGEEVASISRKTSAASIIMDADSYVMEIQPGFDRAFAILIAVAMDELYHEDD